jgi:hypothetical protein
MAAGASTPRRGEPRRVLAGIRNGQPFFFDTRFDIFAFLAGV